MSVSYSCEECGKEFNLQIKLKKHLKAFHEITKVKESPNYLDTTVEFSDNEKAFYFDDLKAKYEGVRKELEALEQKKKAKSHKLMEKGW